jgi:hypothetical protein
VNLPFICSNIPACPWRAKSSCSTGDTRRGNLVTNPVISHEWEIDRKVFTWSFVTQIFHSGQPSYERPFPTKEMISISPLWTFHLSVATFQLHLHIEYTILQSLWFLSGFHWYVTLNNGWHSSW